MAVVAPETVGIKPIHEFDGVYDVWPRGDRPRAIRDCAPSSASASRARTASAPCGPSTRVCRLPAEFAFHGAAEASTRTSTSSTGWWSSSSRTSTGALRTLAWEPTIAEGPAEAPFYEQLLERYGELLAYKVFATFYNTVDEALAAPGSRRADVDYVCFDHLHVQDLRLMMGTTEPVGGRARAARAVLPQREVRLPAQGGRHVRVDPPDAVGLVRPGRHGRRARGQPRAARRRRRAREGRGDRCWTPGHTDGNHSLCVNTPDGIWVSSENGVAADNWHPHLSKIPSVRK